MNRLLKFGVISVVWLPLTVTAGVTLEDIEGVVATDARDIPTTVEATTQPVLAASEPVAVVKQAPVSSKKKPVVQVVATPPVYQFYSSDKAAELLYERNSSILGLNNDRAVVSFLLNEERDNALTAAIMFDAASVPLKGLKLSFGPKIIAGLLSIENADVIGFAANLEALYVAPLKKFPLRISTAFSYAPDVLTFGQSDRIIDWNVRVGLPLTNNIDGFVGARYLQFDTRPGERKLDQQVHIGIRWSGKK
jgi:hypothetical protein